MRLSKEQRIGLAGEKWAYKRLKGLGYDVKMITDFYSQNTDMTIGHLPVEVKLANTTYRKAPNGLHRPRWQFCIHPTAQLMKADWVLILIAVDKGWHYPFILPGHCIMDRRHIQLTSHPTRYRGWLSYWLNRWDIVGSLLKREYGKIEGFSVHPPQQEVA